MDVDITREENGACGLCRKMWNSGFFCSVSCNCLIETMSLYVLILSANKLSYLTAYASEGPTQHKYMNIFIFFGTPQLLVSLTVVVSSPLIVSKTNHPAHS
jgi:hypothetical protein